MILNILILITTIILCLFLPVYNILWVISLTIILLKRRLKRIRLRREQRRNGLGGKNE